MGLSLPLHSSPSSQLTNTLQNEGSLPPDQGEQPSLPLAKNPRIDCIAYLEPQVAGEVDQVRPHSLSEGGSDPDLSVIRRELEENLHARLVEVKLHLDSVNAFANKPKERLIEFALSLGYASESPTAFENGLRGLAPAFTLDEKTWTNIDLTKQVRRLLLLQRSDSELTFAF